MHSGRNFIPKLSPNWPGKLLSWTYSRPTSLKPVTYTCDPEGENKEGFDDFGFWLYRRIAHKENFKNGLYKSDITIVNWPQNDYFLGNLIDVSEKEYQKHLKGSMQLRSITPLLDADRGSP